jgi:hypothetical protein
MKGVSGLSWAGLILQAWGQFVPLHPPLPVSLRSKPAGQRVPTLRQVSPAFTVSTRIVIASRARRR